MTYTQEILKHDNDYMTVVSHPKNDSYLFINYDAITNTDAVEVGEKISFELEDGIATNATVEV
jgi:hypothetical protein